MQAILAAALAVPSSGAAAELRVSGDNLPVALDRSERFEMAGPGGPLSILVAWPSEPPPENGYGIVYALDAAWTFGTLRDAIRLQARRGVVSGVLPTILVAVGYPTEDLVDLERRRADLTGRDAGAGGITATMQFFADRLIPKVESVALVDSSHRMLFGHSFGGSFALWTALERPDLFSHVVAASPSIWTAPEDFDAAIERTDAVPSLLVTAGALESSGAVALEGQSKARQEKLQSRNVIGRARRAARRLGADFVVFPGESHGSVVPSAAARAVGFLWQDVTQ